MKVLITSDSTCDIPDAELERRNIKIFPLKIILGFSEYSDGEDITAERMLDLCGGAEMPTTSAVSIGEYSDGFKKYCEEYDAIIHVSLGSLFSSCYTNACIAAEDFTSVYVVDSSNISSGQGMLVLLASDLVESGLSPEEIAVILREKAEKIDFSFLLERLDYLRKGGRCSALAAFGANVLGVKLSIDCISGKLTPGKKYRGTMKKCISEDIKSRIAEDTSADTRRVILVSIGIDDEITDSCLKYLRSLGIFDEVLSHKAGCTIAAHCGPCCIGLCFAKK